jgi:uncharacterized HAD superfamily protein
LSNHNENGSMYFKRKIGVDINSVLNLHVTQFTEIYNKIFPDKSKISATEIISLPVSDSGIIQEKDERRVFRVKEYWEKMTPAKDVAKHLIKGIKNKLGFDVSFFTCRDCKVKEDLTQKKIHFYNIKHRTKIWLKKYGLIKRYRFMKNVYFEHGNYDRPVTIFQTKYKTRYYYAHRKKIMFFAEDNLNNAIKLADICKYVFLIDQPYNKSNDLLPFNIIRVNDWAEIYNWIRKLC